MEALLITQNKAFLNKVEYHKNTRNTNNFSIHGLDVYFLLPSVSVNKVYTFLRNFGKVFFLPTPKEHFRIIVNAINKILVITHMNFDCMVSESVCIKKTRHIVLTSIPHQVNVKCKLPFSIQEFLLLMGKSANQGLAILTEI